MPAIGQTILHYRIVEKIGQGGMGEVYLADDLSLDRKVALKFLPDVFTGDPERMVRFEREAKILASLNHPNIAAIYGLEQAEGKRFIVMELVEGETLAKRIGKGPLPVDEALGICRQVAEGLEAAHEKGVIHRDLKPGNVMIAEGDRVKILDFGLAKALSGETQSADLAQSPTLTATLTQPGIVMGTAAYMSPEQAKGKAVDKQADIWSFGCILYELLTGRPAFAGEGTSDILAAVIRAEPDWGRFPGIVHWRLREIIQRCLAKELKDRYHDIADVRLDIQRSPPDLGESSTQPMAASGRRWSIRWAVAGMILTAAVAGVVVWNAKRMPMPEARPIVRFSYELAEDQQLELGSVALSVSPDGSQLVYSTGKGLYLRSLDETEARLISGAGDHPRSPFFSPDGKWIAYLSQPDGWLKKIPVTGGTPVVLCPATQVSGGQWASDNTIIYGDGTHGIMRVSGNGGTPERIADGHLASPQLLPGGKSVLFTDISTPPTYKIMVESLESRERKELFAAEWARYLPSGHLIYGYSIWSPEPGTYAVPFNLETLEETGERVLLPELATAVPLAISGSGTVVFIPRIPGPLADKHVLIWVDRNGNEEQVAAEPGYYSIQNISPEGGKLAIAVGGADGNLDIHIYDFVRKTLSRLTFDKAIDGCPLWTPDGNRIVFRSNREGEGIYWKAADGSGEVERLWSIPDRVAFPCDWSGDGRSLVVQVIARATDEDIGILSMEDAREWKPLLEEKWKEGSAQISPNGRFMAYTSDESGRTELYVRPFPDVRRRQWRISINGAVGQRWSRDGRELFYRSGDALMAVPVETDGEFSFGSPRILFRGPYGSPWSVSPDGKRFLMSKPLPPAKSQAAQSHSRKINIILNWLEELKQRVPVK